MKSLRPDGMKQAELAMILQKCGFHACTTTAVSLAERPKESGLQFTREARKAAEGHFKRPERQEKAENRKNGRKTTVWLDEEMRIWCETTAYLREMPVGELIRSLIRAEMKKTAPTAGTVRAAGDPAKTQKPEGAGEDPGTSTITHIRR